MKSPLLILVMLFTLSLITPAQENSPAFNEQGKEQRNKERHFSPQEYTKEQETFIVKEAGLSPSEAGFLFPLFRELKQKQRDTSTKIRNLIKQSRNKNLQEQQYRSILKQLDQLDQAKVNLEQIYHEKWRKQLSDKKILSVIDADRRFDRRMLKHMFPGRNNDKGRK